MSVNQMDKGRGGVIKNNAKPSQTLGMINGLIDNSSIGLQDIWGDRIQVGFFLGGESLNFFQNSSHFVFYSKLK